MIVFNLMADDLHAKHFRPTYSENPSAIRN
jgi:hypothetical protein